MREWCRGITDFGRFPGLGVAAQATRRIGSSVGTSLLRLIGTEAAGCPARLSAKFGRHSRWPSIGTENPIPKEIDHREAAICVPVMSEVQFLLASEPCKPLKPGSVDVVFLVEKDVRVERHCTCHCHNHKETDWQYEVHTRTDQKHRNEEEGRVVAFINEICR